MKNNEKSEIKSLQNTQTRDYNMFIDETDIVNRKEILRLAMMRQNFTKAKKQKLKAYYDKTKPCLSTKPPRIGAATSMCCGIHSLFKLCYYLVTSDGNIR